MIQLQANKNINIIQVYTPTGDYEEEQVEQAYNDLNHVLTFIKKDEVTIIMGDLNPKIGEERQADTIGDYGLGVKNNRGDRLAAFYLENSLTITNTFLSCLNGASTRGYHLKIHHEK